MLDLEPRVHLQEIEPAGRVDQKFNRAGARVAAARPIAAAAAISCSRSAGDTAGDGVSSISF